MPTPNPVLIARSRVATAARVGDDEALTEARRDLHAAKLERAVRTAIDAAPPLTNDQRERIAALLTGGAR